MEIIINYQVKKRGFLNMYSEKKTITHFVSSVSKGSGVMSVIMNYYRHIDREKYQFDFIYFREFPDNYIDEISRLGGNLYRITSPQNFFKFKKDLKIIFKDNNSTILHNHEVYLSVFLRKILSSKIKIVTHSHNTELSDKRISKIRNKILCRNIIKNSNQLIACSNDAGKALYGNANFSTLYNAIDVETFLFSKKKRNEVRKKMDLENEKIIGNIGRLCNQKNQLFLLDIFKELSQIDDNVKLIVIGDGELKTEIYNKVEKLKLKEKVIILPFQENISDYLQVFDVFVLPSLYEGLPVVGVEAQAASLKCFFSDTITKEVNILNASFLSIKNNQEEWAKEIYRELSIDNNNRKKVMNDVFDKKGFNIYYSVKSLENIYNGL